jgi:hypothetical protein
MKAFPAAHRHSTKNFNTIMDETEKIPDWLTIGITICCQNQETARESETTEKSNA